MGEAVRQLLPALLGGLQLDVQRQHSSLNHNSVITNEKKTQTKDLQGNNPVFPPGPTPVHHPSSISSTSVMNSPSSRFISLSSVAYHFSQKNVVRTQTKVRKLTNLIFVEDNGNSALATMTDFRFWLWLWSDRNWCQRGRGRSRRGRWWWRRRRRSKSRRIWLPCKYLGWRRRRRRRRSKSRSSHFRFRLPCRC